MAVSVAEHDRIVKEFATQVNHRANNLLAVIQGLIRMSDASDVANYKKCIEGRISALAQAHSLLSAGNWEGIPFRDLINAELMNFIDVAGPRLRIIGTDLTLPAARAQNAAMILHELATNAYAYGALHYKGGTITVQWQHGDKGMMYDWIEDGCVDIHKPDHFGTGLRLVENITRSTRATLKIEWGSTGVAMHFFQPYDHLSRKLVV